MNAQGYMILSKKALQGKCSPAESAELERALFDGSLDSDPPSYLPMREPLPPRIPDLCPDDWNEK
jgi:hypothetical protein